MGAFFSFSRPGRHGACPSPVQVRWGHKHSLPFRGWVPCRQSMPSRSPFLLFLLGSPPPSVTGQASLQQKKEYTQSCHTNSSRRGKEGMGTSTWSSWLDRRMMSVLSPCQQAAKKKHENRKVGSWDTHISSPHAMPCVVLPAEQRVMPCAMPWCHAMCACVCALSLLFSC